MTTDDDKAALRRYLVERRGDFAETKKRSADQSITKQLLKISMIRQAQAVFVYVSTPDEVDSHRLIDELEASAIVTLVPRIIDRKLMRAVRFPGWSAMEPGRLGILSPPDDEAWEQPIDVAIVPGLGFSLAGDRLGFGAGYYDRWLAAHAQTIRIGVAFDYQIVDGMPVATHDVPMDLIVTESRLVAIKRP